MVLDLDKYTWLPTKVNAKKGTEPIPIMGHSSCISPFMSTKLFTFGGRTFNRKRGLAEFSAQFQIMPSLDELVASLGTLPSLPPFLPPSKMELSWPVSCGGSDQAWLDSLHPSSPSSAQLQVLSQSRALPRARNLASVSAFWVLRTKWWGLRPVTQSPCLSMWRTKATLGWTFAGPQRAPLIRSALASCWARALSGVFSGASTRTQDLSWLLRFAALAPLPC